MNIKAGDLVMVVKPTPCCGSLIGVGAAFRVTRVVLDYGLCTVCGSRGKHVVAYEGSIGALAVRLIRIDPLSEPVTVIEEVVA